MSNKVLLGVIVALYVISLFLPGIVFQDGSMDYGYSILLIGWAGFVEGIFAWYGNLLLFFALIRRNKEKPKVVFITALIALFLGLTAFLVKNLPKDEAGHKILVDHLGIGYYVWIASLILFVVYAYRKMKSNIDPII